MRNYIIRVFLVLIDKNFNFNLKIVYPNIIDR